MREALTSSAFFAFDNGGRFLLPDSFMSLGVDLSLSAFFNNAEVKGVGSGASSSPLLLLPDSILLSYSSDANVQATA
jgi:hypothetical protein